MFPLQIGIDRRGNGPYPDLWDGSTSPYPELDVEA